MAGYTCPTCGEKMERDLLLFMNHTDQHVIEELKKQHPSWITQDGFCLQCLEYFKKAMGKSGRPGAGGSSSSRLVNIGVAESKKRVGLGIAAFAVGLSLGAVFYWMGVPRQWRVFLFLPFFASMIGFFQAKKKLCVVLAQRGVRDMDQGEERIENPSEASLLRRESFKQLVYSIAAAGLLTFLLYLIP